jgi:flagellar biosynthesis/type III secretory pathway protein FliH
VLCKTKFLTATPANGENMKLQKGFAVLATVSLMAVSFGCKQSYDEGFTAGKAQGYSTGKSEGYKEGFDSGDAAGFERAKIYFASADYNAGLKDGKAEGITIGYNQGYGVGKSDGLAQGYTNGYKVGYVDGDADGFEEGYEVGFGDGFDDGEEYGFDIGYGLGFDDGDAYGYEIGLKEGYDAGWFVGYDAGFDDAFGLSVGPTKNQKGYASVLAAFHNDLIDYSKIKAPVKTKHGLVANGRLLLSETSLTNKDTLKRVAVVEQYLVIEMAKQVKGKFGLSAERSLKIAKASNHFRKFASKRALTAEDTNAYASEILGTDFDSIANAYEAGMKGDFNAFNSVMEKAAEKNETSPEKMSEIVAKMFL